MTRVKLFACFYNEAALLPYFLAHYHFVETIEAFVSPSTDATRELLAADPRVVIHDVVMPDGIDDDLKIGWLNAAISRPDGRHDWFIVVDADELVWPPGDPAGATVADYLSTVPYDDRALVARMVQVYRSVADRDLDPTVRPIVLQRPYGVAGQGGVNRPYQKPCVIRANRALAFTPGQHRLEPAPPASLYHWFDGAHWQNADPSFAITRRVRDRADRISAHNRANNYGGQHWGTTEDDVWRDLERHRYDERCVW